MCNFKVHLVNSAVQRGSFWENILLSDNNTEQLYKGKTTMIIKYSYV